MKYYYEPPDEWDVTKGTNEFYNHPMYNKGTLYGTDEGQGVVIIQQRYNPKTKMTWWGPIDPWLIDDIANQESWDEWFKNHKDGKDEHGCFPTFTVREVMWAMRMKPLRKEVYEGKIQWRNKDAKEIKKVQNRTRGYSGYYLEQCPDQEECETD